MCGYFRINKPCHHVYGMYLIGGEIQFQGFQCKHGKFFHRVLKILFAMVFSEYMLRLLVSLLYKQRLKSLKQTQCLVFESNSNLR